MEKRSETTAEERLKASRVGRNMTVRKRMLGAIKRALSEVETLDNLSRGGMSPRACRHSYKVRSTECRS